MCEPLVRKFFVTLALSANHLAIGILPVASANYFISFASLACHWHALLAGKKHQKTCSTNRLLSLPRKRNVMCLGVKTSLSFAYRHNLSLNPDKCKWHVRGSSFVCLLEPGGMASLTILASICTGILFPTMLGGVPPNMTNRNCVRSCMTLPRIGG